MSSDQQKKSERLGSSSSSVSWSDMRAFKSNGGVGFPSSMESNMTHYSSHYAPLEATTSLTKHNNPHNYHNNAGHFTTSDPYYGSVLNEDVLDEAVLEAYDHGYDAEDEDLLDPENQEEESDDELLAQARLDNKGMVWYRRPSLFSVGVMLFLFTFSNTFAATSQLQLTIMAVCSMATGNDPSLTCDSPLVKQQNVQLQKWITLITGVLRILVSGKLGKLSDLYGRKPVIMFCILCVAVSQVGLFVVLNPSITTFKPYLLVLVCFVESLGGSTMMLLALANTYVIDVVDENRRMQSMGTLISFLYCGIGVGPLTASLLKLQPLDVIKISIGLFFVTSVCGFFLFPESRSHKLKAKTRRLSTLSLQSEQIISPAGKVANRIGLGHLFDLLSSLKLLWITIYDENGKLDMSARVNVLILLFQDFVIQSCSLGLGMVMMLYAVFQFHWNNSMMSMFISTMMLAKATVLLGLNPWLNNKLTSTFVKSFDRLDFVDLSSLVICLVSEVVGGSILIVATSTPSFMSNTIFSSLGSLAGPTLHSSILKYNKKSENNGEFFGCLALLRNTVSLLAPLFFLSIYQSTLDTNPKFVFYIMTSLFVLSLFVCLFLKI